jgi:8-oxo-dGTP pyrophosphatase MutT (NUDIX family)
VDVGATWLEAAVGECQEETGWHVTVTGLFGAYSKPATRTSTCANARRVQSFGVVLFGNAVQQVGQPDAEVLEMAFLSTDYLPAPLFVPDPPAPAGLRLRTVTASHRTGAPRGRQPKMLVGPEAAVTAAE